MYGKGRVFYSTLGHTEEAWNDPDIRKMYFEAIRWAMDDGRQHGKPSSSDASGLKPTENGVRAVLTNTSRFLAPRDRNRPNRWET